MDFLNKLDRHLEKRIEWDNRYIGQQTMQNSVLRWLMDHRRDMPPLLRDSLVRSMQGSLDAAMVERPALIPPLEGTCNDA